MKFAKGDVVIYPAHGVGVVVGREHDLVMLEFANGLSVTLPVVRAQEQLRPPVSKDGLREVQETLRDEGEPSREVWLKRKRETETKLTGGDPLQLAEVVRDGARRKQLLVATKPSARLSVGENDLYEKARRLLAGEVGVACGFDADQANAWIDEQIAPAAA